MLLCLIFVFFKQETAYEVRISNWSSDVCSSDLRHICRLLLRMAAPQDEDLGGRVGGDRGDRGVGELFPPLALMRCRHAALDRQAIVEQQHALACPMFEITMRRPRNPKVALNLDRKSVV